MRKLLLAVLAIAVSPPLFAQNSGNITSNQSVCIGVSAEHSTVAVQVTGTWTGTLQPQVAVQGQAATNSQVVPSTSTTPAATITANGVYYANVGGLSQFCILGNTVASGTAVIYLNVSKGVNASTLGGSGSVVTSIVQTGLMAQYAFTEGSGTTLTDASGNGNNATFGGLCTNQPTWVTNGLQFAASSSQCVVLPQALSTAHTIMVFASRGPFCDAGCPATGAGTGNYDSLIGTTGDPNSAVTHGLTIAAFTSQWGSAGGGAGISHVANGSFITSSGPGFIGNHLFTSVLDATTDHIYFDNVESNYPAGHGGSYGTQLASQQYTFGGQPTGGGAQGYSNTILYYALFYSTELTAAQVSQNYYAILSIMQNRNVQTAPIKGLVSASNALLLVGDSITAGLAGSTCCTVDAYTTSNFGLSGSSSWDFTTMSDWRDDALLPKGAAKNVWTYMIGSNATGSIVSVATAATQWGYELAPVRNRRAAGWKTIALTIPDYTGRDAAKNFLNSYIRQNWASAFDGFADIAAQPDLGADGAAANPSGTYFNGDGIHIVATGDGLISNLLARAVDRLWAPKDFSSATTYTTTAPAATAITATSESVNTVTVTSTLNPPVGSDVIITGVTPAGYNTSATNKCYVVTTAGANFTCLNGTSGLGAGSVFGTAAVPTQKNQDVYVILGGSATSPSFTLQSCVGYTGQNFYFKNTNTTSPWVLTPFQSSETIDGAATLTMPTASSGNNPVVVLQAQLVSAAAGGCTWKRLQ
jgi:hypothetical protein